MNGPTNHLTLEKSQGTSLTVVSDALTELQKVEAGIGALALRFNGVAYNVQTTNGMEQAKADRLEVREVRYTVQRTAKAAKDWLNEQKKTVEQKAEFIVSAIEKIEFPIDEQIKAEEKRKADEKAAREKAERERIAAIAVKLAAIRAHAVVAPGTSSKEIDVISCTLISAAPTESEYGDMYEAAMRALDETVLTLKKHRAAAEAHEQQQVELARQIEEQRIERERIEEAKRAAAKEAKERMDELAEQRRVFEQQQADARAADQKRREEEAAELARARAKLEEEQRAMAEQERERAAAAAAIEAERQAEMARAEAARTEDLARRATIARVYQIPSKLAGATVAQLTVALQSLDEQPDCGELNGELQSAVCSASLTLEAMLDRAQAAERAQEEAAAACANAEARVDPPPADAPPADPQPADPQPADAHAVIELVAGTLADLLTVGQPAPAAQQAAAHLAAEVEERPTLKLGEIVARLGFVVTAKFLADLGFPAADIPGTNAKLYKPSEFGAICRSLIAHIAKVADEFDAARN